MIVGLRTFRSALLQPEVLAEVIQRVLDVMDVAVDRLELGLDPLERVFRSLLVGDDQQVVLGDDPIGQADLVEEQLEARLEPDPFQLELNGVLRPELLAVDGGFIEHDRGPQDSP